MENPSSSQVEYEETADAYARHEGCFQAHQRRPFRFKDAIKDIHLSLQPTDAHGLVHQSGLKAVCLPDPVINIDELDLASTEQALNSFYDSRKQTSCFFPLVDHIKELQLPLELVQLDSDPIEDETEYLETIVSHRTCNMSQQWLPLTPTNDKRDEGLQFPPGSSKLHSLLLREIDREKVLVSQQSLALEHEVCGSKWDCSSDNTRPAFPVFPTMTNRKGERITPPLSPMADDTGLFAPDPGVCVIDLVSEPSTPALQLEESLEVDNIDPDIAAPETCGQSPMLTDLPELRQSLRTLSKNFTVDVPVVLTSSSSDGISGPDIAAPETCGQSPMLTDLPELRQSLRTLSKNFTVDVPVVLTSSSSDGISGRGLLTKPGILEGPETEPMPCESVDFQNFFDDAFTLTLEAHQTHTNQEIKQERYDPADSIARIPVPIMNFATPAAEERSQRTCAKDQFSTLLSHSPHLLNMPKLSQTTGTDCELKWAPFPRGNRHISTLEVLDAPSDEFQRLFSLNPVPELNSASYLSPGRQLAILQVLEDEEIIDLASDVDKTPSSILTGEVSQFFTDTPVTPDSGPGKPSLLASGLIDVPRPRRRKATDGSIGILPVINDADTTSKLLSGFMEMRAVKRPRQSSLQGPPKRKPPGNARQSPQMTDHTVSITQEPESLRVAPAPNMHVPQEKAVFTVSLGLEYSILRLLETSWPREHLLDRDYSPHNNFVSSPGSTKRTTVPSPLSFDADVTLTPTAGIIVTNLLQVKQRTLPDSGLLSRIRQRTLHVSKKYETLYVLVSEGNPSGDFVGHLSNSDLAAYADFMRFTIGLHSGMTTYLVPGATQTVAKWILSLMCQYNPHAVGLQRHLSATENTWEVFFRRVGLNVAAAQVLSGTLFETAGARGLIHFLSMSAEDRLKACTQILGRSRVLHHVHEIFDQPWA